MNGQFQFAIEQRWQLFDDYLEILKRFLEEFPGGVCPDGFDETIKVPILLSKSKLLVYLTVNENNSMTLDELIEAIEHDLFLRIRDAGNDP